MYKIFFIYSLFFVNFFIASDSDKFSPKKCSYNVPEFFENGEVRYEISTTLERDGLLFVNYSADKSDKGIVCSRCFYPDGVIKEIYRGDKGFFPSNTIVTHRLDGFCHISYYQDRIDIVVSQEDFNLAKLLLENTIQNKSGYKGDYYPWKALFAEVTDVYD